MCASSSKSGREVKRKTSTSTNSKTNSIVSSSEIFYPISLMSLISTLVPTSNNYSKLEQKGLSTAKKISETSRV